MLATIVIGVAIVAYAGWVSYRKYKQYKAGQFCCLGEYFQAKFFLWCSGQVQI